MKRAIITGPTAGEGRSKRTENAGSCRALAASARGSGRAIAGVRGVVGVGGGCLGGGWAGRRQTAVLIHHAHSSRPVLLWREGEDCEMWAVVGNKPAPSSTSQLEIHPTNPPQPTTSPQPTGAICHRSKIKRCAQEKLCDQMSLITHHSIPTPYPYKS